MHPQHVLKLWTTAAPNTAITWGTKELDYPFIGDDYLSRARELFDEVAVVDEPLVRDYHDVTRSDYVRLRAIYDEGGIYADTDILCFGSCELPAADFYITRIEDYYQQGFVAGNRGSETCRALLALAPDFLNPADYQCIGTRMLRAAFAALPDAVRLLPKNYVHPFVFYEQPEIFDRVTPLPAESIGIHWFAGSHLAGVWVNKLTEANYKSFDNTFSEVCRHHDL
jgi:hypothetical protein